MARPTDLEPKIEDASRGKEEENVSEQVDTAHEHSGQKASGTGAGKDILHISEATDPCTDYPNPEDKSTSVTATPKGGGQDGSASLLPKDPSDSPKDPSDSPKDTSDSPKDTSDIPKDTSDSNNLLDTTKSEPISDSKDPTTETSQENAPKDGGNASDNDTGERPVREKLRETSIAGIPNAPIQRPKSPDDMSMASQQSSAADGASDTSSVEGKSRSTKKRSIDDVQPEDQDGDSNTDDDGGHRRKRSRESTPGDSAENGKGTKVKDSNDTPEKASDETKKDSTTTTAPEDTHNSDGDVPSKILSPKKKRSRDQFDKDLKEEATVEKEQAVKTSSEDVPENTEAPSDHAKKDKGEPEKKRHRDNSQERDTTAEPEKIPSTNAFSNSSAVSPFASLASSKSPPAGEKPSQTTSSSAFASSGLAAFAGSDKSPFSNLGGSTPSSGFGSAAATDSKKPEATGFAAAASTTTGASPFASTGTSGFGKLGGGGGGAGFGGSAFGGGFAAATPPAGGLTSFAAPAGPAVLGSGSSAKPFGAPADAAEEDEEEDDEKPGFEGLEDEKEDGRFFKQQTETGEEDEETYFACKAKLFHFDGKEWKERGLGNFKLNVTKAPGEDAKISSARLIMRADGALRVILNTPVFKGMTVGDASGEEPSTKQLHLASLENGRSVPILLRTGNNNLAKELYNKIESLKKIL
ncbi:hypothetical protein FQN54_008828 [Arachnomyces sp. PD_36]|nr:hypothetical protein FQN54_008828 [Arachnomyces sp. PD_36]